MFDAMLGGNAVWFGVPALIGTGIFAIRLVLMSVGGSDGDLDLDIDPELPAHHDSTAGFKAISFQSVMAFAMGFGWGGLAGLNGFHWSVPGSVGLGIVCGIGMVWLLAILLKAVHDLQSHGNISIADALGKEADVYVSLPEHGKGRGQIRVVINERARFLNAESDSLAAPTSSRVRVVRVNDDNSVLVTPVST